MTKDLQRINQAQQQLKDAEEINAFEAITLSKHEGTKKAETIDFGVLMGRAQMAASISKMTDMASLMALKQVKESKQYKELKGMPYQKMTGAGTQLVILTGTWAEFCEVMGSSKSNIDDRLRNLEIFGESALESMQQIGMTTRDLKKLRKLPEEELKAIVDGGEVKVSDREEALELIEEMAVKHRKETRSLRDKLNQSEQTNKANSTLLAEKNKKIDELTLALDTPITEVQERQKEAERNGKLLQDLSIAEHKIDVGLAHFFDVVATIQSGSRPIDVDEAYQDALTRMVSRLLEHALDAGHPSIILNKLKEFEQEAGLYQFDED